MHFDRFEQFPIEDLIMQDRWRREEAAEPFFTKDQPCEYCGHPASKCGCDDAPDDPVCPDLYPLLMAARNVREIVNVCKAHRLTCAACGGARKPVASETAEWRRERAA
ncbi:MAG TPA: hypothetical protein VMQ76_12085 [Terracidiphilus sp.]|jgi:hypothetical protein|nr:hypothetical protein [Terracidiphilus sp.]